jgi:Flp pilus assembly protein TadD
MRTTGSNHRVVLLLIGAGMLFAFFLVIAQGPAPEAASDVPSERPEAASPTPKDDQVVSDDAHAMTGRLSEARFASNVMGGAAAPANSDVSTNARRSAVAEEMGLAPESSDRANRERYVRAVIALRNGETLTAVEQLESLLDAFSGDRALRAHVRMNLARAEMRLADEVDGSVTARSETGVCAAEAARAVDGAMCGADGAVSTDGAVSMDARTDAAPTRRSAHVRHALSLSEDALALAPSSSEAWNVRGLALLSARRAAEAVAAFEKSVALDPNNVHAQNNLGYVRILRGDRAGAILPLREGRDAAERLGIDPPAHLLNNLGVALESTGAFEEAREAFRAAADAGHPHASVSLARVEDRLPRGENIASAETLAVR